ncbi:conserved hypothetical protein [Theileria orientalis strain Shintoku]|uniref:Uncharacterized protein n=1 Tax=Theileria orientalis strain Shintoku TaxID=869250 RepID=J4D5G6_THEOR|nr:conserved hypothetical protein [Theileria orientalis strain Shintoku]BAM38950.1 conserved hypothetical protein [Theileria orientalis strain Shintoku]|eukprot:XP_009689251.1 conserved hypothetical protein [Theileria orientalis strain Shintoku]
MKENEIALELIGRIGINNFKDKDFVESIKKCVLHSEIGSSNTINVSNDSNSDRELDDHDNSEKKSSLKKESLRNKTYNLKEEVPIQVQLLEHLVYLRNESGFSKHDFLIKEDLKCRSLLIFAKNLLVELKRNSSWQSVLDDKSENVLEYPFEGMEKLFALILMMTRLEKYLRSESTAAPILANNVLLSFRYIFQSESSNLAVIQHPEWAIEYLRECVKKYMAVFKKAKSDMKLDCTNYFKALMPEPYCDDYGLLEEFVLIGAECSVDDVASSWCLLIAKEARLFVYSRLPFLVYDYFMENEDDRVGLRELTRMIASPKKSTVLEVSRSSFSDDKVTSVIYSLVGSMVEFASYLRGFDPASSYELFSDFDNNTIVPFIMIQFYRYSNAGGSEGYTDGGASNSTPNTAINTDINNANNSAINTGNNSDINNANNSTDSHSNNDIVKNYGNNNLSGGNAARYADGDYGADYEASDSNTGNEGSDNMPSRDGDEATLESKILLCFESNVLYGCLDALLEMENKHCMSISKKLLTLESFSDSIGVRTGLNTTLYLQDDQFLSQVSNVLIAVLNLVDRRCQCLKFVESKKQYAAKVVVPLIEYFIDSVKHIWNSLENVLESCTISCMLLESATVLHEFLLKFTLSEFMPDTLASLESITQKMVGIINQYFVELYYEPFKNVHRQPLEVMAHITHKLLQMCALSSCKNYNKILRTTLSDMEKVLISTLIPSKSLDFILMDEEDVETSLNNCEYILESVKKLVEPRECEETMQQVQDVKVILSMETVELKTSAEYLNLLGTGKISSKNNMEENNQESQGNTTNQINKGDSFVSSIIFDDFEGDCTDDIHDSLIVSKIKQKLKVRGEISKKSSD